MPLVLADRVRETTTTTGTGTIFLAGPVSGFQGFSTAIGNGNTTYYTIVDAATGAWEVGLGTYTSSGSTLARTTVLSSSNSDALVPFASGVKDVFVTQPAERAVYVLGAGTGLAAGAAAFTVNGVPYASATNTLTTGSALTFDGTNLTQTAGTPVFTIFESASGNNNRLILTQNSGLTTYNITYSTATTNGHVFQIGGGEQMRLTSTGLGIGTSSHVVKLGVAGNAIFSGSVPYIALSGSQTTTASYLQYTVATSQLDIFSSGAIDFQTNGSSASKMRLDSSGNLGLGVTPSAWVTLKPLEIAGLGNAISGFPADAGIYVTSNAYYGSAGWRYGQTGKLSTRYSGESGIHSWSVAPSGTAGNAISFTQAMTLDASGNLALGQTSASFKFDVLSGADVAIRARTSNNNEVLRVESAGTSVSAIRLINTAAAGTYISADSAALAFLTSNTERARIDSSGNLGIGTSSPATKLDISGNDRLVRLNATVNNALIRYSLGGTAKFSEGLNDPFGWILYDDAAAAYRMVVDYSGNLGIGTSSPAFKLHVVGTQRIEKSGAGYEASMLSFYTPSETGAIYRMGMASGGAFAIGRSDTSTTNLTLDSSGNLGIGATSPAQKLVVSNAGAAGFEFDPANAIIQTYNRSSGAYIDMRQYALNIRFFTGSSPTETMRLDSSGNLGLGVTPSAWSLSGLVALQVKNGSLYGYQNEFGAQANTYYNAGWKYITTAPASQYTQTAGQHIWYNAPSGTAGNTISFTQAMTLDASGRLGIGETSPSQKLTVGATADASNFVRVQSSTAIGIFGVDAGGGYVGTDNAYALRLFTNNTERARITSGGDLLVGTQSGAFTGRVVALQATSASNVFTAWNSATTGDNSLIGFFTDAGVGRGSIDYNRAGGLVAYNTTSDYRAKDIIGPITNSGEVIDALKVYEGVMKGATQSRPMLVAHEAQEHAPYAVSGVKDEVNEDGTPKFQQMDVSSLVPLLLAELQSLRARVAQLESKGA